MLVKASRGVGLEAVTQALVEPRGSARLMGEVLIGGTAALLLCVFLSPRFIDFMRERQFGQHIREEGPEGHHTKAGTPTMGGLIILVAIAVPFLILTDGDWRAIGVFLHGARLRGDRLRRRLHEDRPAPLARPPGPDEARSASC